VTTPRSARLAAGVEAIDAGSVEVIKAAALQKFREHGYHGTSVREIANAAGISVAGLYHHFSSKLEILFALLTRVMVDLIDGTEAALAEVGDDPSDQLRAVVTAHVRFHTERRDDSFVGNTELRSLNADMRATIVGYRDRQQRIFDQVIARGAKLRVFQTPHPIEASRAIVTMSTAVATWYRRDGPLTPAEIAGIYGDLALATVEAGPRSSRPRGRAKRARASSAGRVATPSRPPDDEHGDRRERR
jgi:AcrR family transcriptional regulator